MGNNATFTYLPLSYSPKAPFVDREEAAANFWCIPSDQMQISFFRMSQITLYNYLFVVTYHIGTAYGVCLWSNESCTRQQECVWSTDLI